jgi:hypothetical protein
MKTAKFAQKPARKAPALPNKWAAPDSAAISWVEAGICSAFP